MKKLLLGIAATPLLVFGVASATQNEEHQTHKVTICHHTHSEKNPTVTIEVDKHAVKHHLKHGDTVGECPKPPKEEPPVTPPVTETPKAETPVTPTPTETSRASEPVVIPEGFTGK